MRKTDAHTLNRLWETLRAMGLDAAQPSQCSQALPYVADETERRKMWLVESLFTGLHTNERDIALRCWVQAHGYAEVLGATGHEPGSYLRDRVLELRCRVEGALLRGEV